MAREEPRDKRRGEKKVRPDGQGVKTDRQQTGAAAFHVFVGGDDDEDSFKKSRSPQNSYFTLHTT